MSIEACIIGGGLVARVGFANIVRGYQRMGGLDSSVYIYFDDDEHASKNMKCFDRSGLGLPEGC